MHVLLLSSLRAHTGNAVTSRRLAALLRARGAAVSLIDPEAAAPSSPPSPLQLTAADVIVAVHAFRSGRLTLDEARCAAGIPTVVVLSGTDVNEDLSAAPSPPLSRTATILAACARASAIVAFTEAARDRFVRLAGAALAAKVVVIPQGVSLDDEYDGSTERGGCINGGASAGAGAEASDNLRAAIGLAADARVLLLVCGLRSVKAPLFASEAVAAWQAADPRIALVTVGPALEPAVAEAVLLRTGAAPPLTFGGRDGLFYHPPVARRRLLSWIRQADCLVNTSVSEGQCNALLEAFLVGTPVVARRNAGNAALVGEAASEASGAGLRGALFDDPEGCVAACKRLLYGGAGAGGSGGSVARARFFAESQHAPEREAAAWRALLERVAGCSLH